MDVDVAVKAPAIGSIDDIRVRGHRRDAQDSQAAGRRKTDNFSINKLDSLLGAFNSVVGAVLGIGLLVTSISLFVGGIGVMNIMFVSVTETHARDRHPQGDRCKATQHPDAVPV